MSTTVPHPTHPTGAVDLTDPSDGAGPSGPSGPTGPTGPTGATGATGASRPDATPPVVARRPRPRPDAVLDPPPRTLKIVRWVDPVVEPLGVHPCSRYVELYWLGILGPSATWLLRRLTYGLDVHGDAFLLDLPETARALGLGDRMGRNSPFRRALQRLCTFDVARGHGPDALAVRTAIPPLPLRYASRLPEALQRSHRRWLEERRLPEAEQTVRRAERLARGLASGGRSASDIEHQLGEWRFHPAVAFHAASVATGGPGSRSTGPGVHGTDRGGEGPGAGARSPG